MNAGSIRSRVRRTPAEIRADILALERETEGLLDEILGVNQGEERR